MPKKIKNLKEQAKNNQNNGEIKNRNVYVINDKKYNLKPGQISNYKRKEVLDNKKENNKNEKENKEKKEKKENIKKEGDKKKNVNNNSLVVINSRDKNRIKYEKKVEY